MEKKKRHYIKYFTDEKKSKINEKSLRDYEKYLRAYASSNPDSKDSTLRVYKNYMMQFLVFIEENYDNMHLYDEDLMEEMVDILDHYKLFCQETLKNNKKVINLKLSTVSSFYMWSVKRKKIEHHPFSGKLDRMANAKQEKILDSHFLTDEEVKKVRDTLIRSYNDVASRYDIQDLLIFLISIDSACRVGATARLTLNSLDVDSMVFNDIREKGSKITDIPYYPITSPFVKEWLKLRKQLEIDCDAFFVTRVDGEWRAMSTNTIYSRVKKIGLILGIENLRCHSLRKTSINLAYEKSGDIQLVQAMANHESSETTVAHYLKPKSTSDVRDQLLKLMQE